MEAFKREIFGQLGNLFYALAIEQHMSLITSGELKMAVRKDWLVATKGSDSQNKVSEAAHLVGVAIDSLQTDQTPSPEAFSAFETFFRQHEEQFSHALKQQILETADTIVNILPSDGRRNECYEDISRFLVDVMGVSIDQQKDLIAKMSDESGGNFLKIIRGALSASAASAIMLFLIPVYAVLILYSTIPGGKPFQ